jgi:type II secretory pathway pseudopilin PulG
MASRMQRRRRAQAGTTLVELLVSLMIVGLAVSLVVGTFSTASLNATLAKRNTAVQAVVQYELDKISGNPFIDPPTGYSECFPTEVSDATEPPLLPEMHSNLGDACTSRSFTIRADVTVNRISTTRQLWTVSIASWPEAAQISKPISVYKVNR